MLQDIGQEMDALIQAAQMHAPLLLKLLAVLWAINIFNWIILRGHLNVLGLVPRNIFGLPGIVFSPILHANFNHLFFNSLPLFCLSLFIS